MFKTGVYTLVNGIIMAACLSEGRW